MKRVRVSKEKERGNFSKALCYEDKMLLKVGDCNEESRMVISQNSIELTQRKRVEPIAVD